VRWPIFQDDEAFVIGLNLAAEELGIGRVADRKRTFRRPRSCGLRRLGDLDSNAGDALFSSPMTSSTAEFQSGSNLGICQNALGHDLAGAKLVAAMNQKYLGRNFVR